MLSFKDPSRQARPLFQALPGVILAGGLALTWLLGAQLAGHERALERAEFELRVTEIVSSLQRRMLANAQILHGVAGLFASGGAVTRDEFHRYVEALRLPESFSGIQGIGYATLVQTAEKARHLAFMRAQGLPDYDIHPPGDREAYSAVIFVEPFDWRNQRAIGFDLLTDPVRAAAAASARDENQVALSDPVTLKQETDQDVQAGVLILLPDYRPDLPLDTPEQRRLALRGWIYAAIRVQDLMDAYLGGEYPELSRRLAIEIHAGDSQSPDTLLFSSNPEPATRHYQLVGERWMTFGGNEWNIRIAALPDYLSFERDGDHSRTVMAAGVLLTLALAGTVFVMVRNHLRVTAALAAADRSNLALAERTRELAASEGRVQAKLEALLSPEGDLETLDLADIIDCRELQSIMENFFRLTNLAVALLDLKGRVLVATGWQDICTQFHRVHPDTAHNCLESDTQLSQGVEAGSFRAYRCKNGMLDVATPIMIGGRHVGNLFLGQFFFEDEPLEREAFRAQARRYGFDEAAYLAAYDRVPRWSREKVSLVMHFYMQFAQMISRLSHGNLQLARALTEVQRGQEALVAAKEKAEAANRAKSIFLANMSHEIRTPLNAVLGFAQVLARDTGLNAAQRESLVTIQRGGEHLLALINDILDMAKIDAGRMTSQVAPFDLPQLIAEIEAFFRQAARDRGLNLFVEPGPIPRYVVGDKQRLRQVLINLMGNAIKFTRVGGVTLRVARVTGEDIRFSVEDTGLGIAPEERDRLFKPFSQTTTGHQVGEGTGLGLALCTQYLRLMGGEISLDSTPGQGSCFSFRLRLPPTDAEAPADAQEQTSVVGLEPGQPVRRVLIVDDLADNREPLRALLASLDPESTLLEFREAADGGEAVALWETWRPNVIFMDMRMPGLSGEEATREIRALEADRPDRLRTVIVALTANAFNDSRDQFLANGCDEFLGKPFRAEDLFALLEHHAGLRFIRAGAEPATPVPLAPEELTARLAALPQAWRSALKDAVVLGDFGRITKLIEPCDERDPALGKRLAQWAYHYDLEAFSRALSGLERPPLASGEGVLEQVPGAAGFGPRSGTAEGRD